MRHEFFMLLDNYLPRNWASAPYEIAFQSVRRDFILHGLPCQLWTRNSYRHGNFVFGLSDLDLTLYIQRDHITKGEYRVIQAVLHHAKKMFPYLGETNLYLAPLAEQFSSSLNLHERQRDPQLDALLPPSSSENRYADDIVFLIRMLHSDRLKLIHQPHLRQKKWRSHLWLTLGWKMENELIDFNMVVEAILQRLDRPTKEKELVRGALYMLKNPLFDEVAIYHWNMTPFWKFIFPHRYLWFERNDLEEGWDNFLAADLLQITMRQIDWEIWGLMSQYPFLPHHELMLRRHLLRLGKAANALDPRSDYPDKIEKLIQSAETSFSQSR